MPRRHPPPFADRISAARPITGVLLSAATGESLELAERFVSAWFDAARTAAEGGVVLVFDDFVIGPPCPLLLEAAHHVRVMRRAEHSGLFDDEEERWYEEHADDDDAWEPPSIPDGVLAAMRHGQESDRIASGSVVSRAVWQAFGRDRECWMSLVHLGLAIERLLVELAGAIRIGDAAVVDARLRGERIDGLGFGRVVASDAA